MSAVRCVPRAGKCIRRRRRWQTCQAVHGHVQEPGEAGEWPAQAEASVMMPMCSIEEYANMRLMSRAGRA